MSAVRHVYDVHGDQDAVAQFVYDEATQDETAAYLARNGRGGAGGEPLPSFGPLSGAGGDGGR